MDGEILGSLYSAARRGQRAECQHQLNMGADPDQQYGKWSSTPLHAAAANGHLEVVQALLDASAAVDSVNSGGATPLHWAVTYWHVNVCRALLAGGADPKMRNQRNNQTAREMAVLSEKHDCVLAIDAHTPEGRVARAQLLAWLCSASARLGEGSAAHMLSPDLLCSVADLLPTSAQPSVARRAAGDWDLKTGFKRTDGGGSAMPPRRPLSAGRRVVASASDGGSLAHYRPRRTALLEELEAAHATIDALRRENDVLKARLGD